MDRPLRKTLLASYPSYFVAAAVACCIIALVAWAVAARSTRTARVARANIAIGTVSRGEFDDFVPLRVSVVPRDVVVVDSAEGGGVEKILVRAGDKVETGQVLAVLSNPELEARVLEQRRSLIESVTQLRNYQATLEQSRLNNELARKEIEYNVVRLTHSLERREKLVDTGIIARASVEELRDELDSDKKKLELRIQANNEQENLRLTEMPVIRAQISSLQRDLELNHGKLERLTVRAPADGRITSIDLKIGQTLRQGERLAEMALDTGFTLTQQVDEFYSSRIRAGQIGNVEIGGRLWQIRATLLHPEVVNGTVKVDFEFIGKAPEPLLAGQTLIGKLTLARELDALSMPAGPYLESSAGAWVFVLATRSAVAIRTPVVVGRRTTDQVEILDGLRPGDRIITSDYRGLEQVDRVVID